MKGSLRRWRTKAARVGLFRKIRLQCFQTLEYEVHNERSTATVRSARSAALLSGMLFPASLSTLSGTPKGYPCVTGIGVLGA